jgi:hypothetical protein
MQRAGVTLLKFGVIGRDDPWVWWTGKAVHGYGKRKLEPAPQGRHTENNSLTQEDVDAFAPF